MLVAGLAVGILAGGLVNPSGQSVAAPLLEELVASAPAAVATTAHAPVAAGAPIAAPATPSGSGGGSAASASSTTTPTSVPTTKHRSATKTEKLPAIRHVWLVVLSGESYAALYGPKSKAHYLDSSLLPTGTLLTNYYAVAHGALADDVALLSGQGPTPQLQANCPEYETLEPGTIDSFTGQARGQGCVFPATVSTLAGQFAANGLTWRAYIGGQTTPSADQVPPVVAPTTTTATTTAATTTTTAPRAAPTAAPMSTTTAAPTSTTTVPAPTTTTVPTAGTTTATTPTTTAPTPGTTTATPASPLPPAGTSVGGAVEDDRRTALMRTHSGLHVLCGVVFRDFGALVTGGNMEPLTARMDFDLPEVPDGFRAAVEAACNAEVSGDRRIDVRVLPREEAFAIPDIIRTATNLVPADVKEVRIIDIVGLDQQADGGTHVASTSQIGRIEIVKMESKGRGFRQLRIRIAD